MRVLFVNPGLGLGGAEQNLLLLLQGFKGKGVEACVAVFGEGPFRDRLSALEISTVVIRPPRGVRRVARYRLPRTPLKGAALAMASFPTIVRLVALARRAQADVIHTNGLKAHLLGGVAGRLVRIPVVWHLHDFPPEGLVRPIFAAGARKLASIIIANSDAVAESIQSKDGRGPSVTRIYNPVDLGRFRPAIARGRVRTELGLKNDAPLVGLVAHLTPWKGHELFLSIARLVAEVVPKAHFVITGGEIYETDGHEGYAAFLNRRAAALGVGDRVTFLGLREDIPEVLADLDVLVHCPTLPEPFGRVLAEAMAVGCPAVAASCGGIPEVVMDGVTGFLVPPNDVSGFASAVVRLLVDSALRKRFGEAGHLRAAALFGVEAHTLGVLKAYQTVIGMRRRWHVGNLTQ